MHGKLLREDHILAPSLHPHLTALLLQMFELKLIVEPLRVLPLSILQLLQRAGALTVSFCKELVLHPLHFLGLCESELLPDDLAETPLVGVVAMLVDAVTVVAFGDSGRALVKDFGSSSELLEHELGLDEFEEHFVVDFFVIGEAFEAVEVVDLLPFEDLSPSLRHLPDKELEFPIDITHQLPLITAAIQSSLNRTDQRLPNPLPQIEDNILKVQSLHLKLIHLSGYNLFRLLLPRHIRLKLEHEHLLTKW